MGTSKNPKLKICKSWAWKLESRIMEQSTILKQLSKIKNPEDCFVLVTAFMNKDVGIFEKYPKAC